MSLPFDYNVLVIGSGPGGYVAAIRASQLGLKTAVVEKEKLGGVCLNIGCIPSKSLIHQAEIFQSIKQLQYFGAKIDLSEFDYEKVYNKSRKTVDTLSKGIEFLLRKNNIDLIFGEGKISGEHQVTINGENQISAQNIVIATGSRSREISGFEFDGEYVLSSKDVLLMKKLPKSMIILGAGAIGMEFAHVFNSFGVDIHVVELMDSVLPAEDRETADILHKSFAKRGIRISVSTKAVSLKKGNGLIELIVEGKDGTQNSFQAEKLLVCVGRIPNTENIGLANIGLETKNGFIPVGDYYKTKLPHIYAVGDVINTPQLAHVASKEGEIAVEHIAGNKTEKIIDQRLIPNAVYSVPEIGSFGYTEEKAKDAGLNYKKTVIPYRSVGKAVAVEQTEGIAKIIYDPDTKEIFGAHIAGLQATELIHEILFARKARLLPEDIAGMVHAHPTLSEIIMESMKSVYGCAIHI